MCEYCSNNDSRDSYATQEIFSEDIDLGFAGKMLATVRIAPKDKELCIDILNCGNGADKEYVTKISYCPFCGERL